MPGQVERFLRNVLRADALLCGAGGLLLLLLAGPIVEILGVADVHILGMESIASLRVDGAILLAWAGLVAYFATRPTIVAQQVAIVMWVNIVFTLLVVVVLLARLLPLSTVGGWAFLIVAVVVASFAALQFWGLRRA